MGIVFHHIFIAITNRIFIVPIIIVAANPILLRLSIAFVRLSFLFRFRVIKNVREVKIKIKVVIFSPC